MAGGYTRLHSRRPDQEGHSHHHSLRHIRDGASPEKSSPKASEPITTARQKTLDIASYLMPYLYNLRHGDGLMPYQSARPEPKIKAGLIRLHAPSRGTSAAATLAKSPLGDMVKSD